MDPTPATPTTTTVRPQPTRRKTRRNKAPARWAVVAATALTFAGFWSAITATPAAAESTTAADTAVPAATATSATTAKSQTTTTTRLRTRGS